MQTKLFESLAESMDHPFDPQKSGRGFLELLDQSSRVSVRLSNAIRAAEAQGILPYHTIEAYLEAGTLGRFRMSRVKNIGRKSVAELDLLIAEASLYQAMQQPGEPPTQANEAATPDIGMSHDEDVLRLPLDAFLAKQRTVSTRLLNAISNAISAGTCPFETVADYLRCDDRQTDLQKIANLGRGSAIEFERLVARSIRTEARQSIQTNDDGYVDIGSIVRAGLSLLTSRQQEVLVERLIEKRTLEAVASVRGLTRERVRQIEAKSLRVLSTKFGPVLRDSANLMCSQLHKEGLFELTLEDFARLSSCEATKATFYLALLKKLDIDQSTFGLFESNVFIRSQYLPRNTWKEALTAELKTQPLPLVLDRVLTSITSVPRSYIRDYFERKWGPQASAPGIVPSYGTTRMCIDVLRKAGRPLHTSDVRARICAQFQVDIEEHAINATLGRNKEVIITAPGTYALYETLPFTRTQIQSIRNIAHEHLAERGLFLSSKILFEQAFVSKPDEYTRDLNHYLVMGIVQDDERFITKRGNMVGLATFDVTETYTPLQDEIRKMVLDHGPITLSEIAKRLSDTRRLCNDSGIRLVLSQSPDIIQTGRRTFDSLHRFFETRDAYDNLLLAVRISLLEKKKTTYAITQDLNRLQVHNVTPHLIESLLLSMDDVVSHGEVYELVGAAGDLADYNDAVVHTLRKRGNGGDVQAILCGSVSPERVTKLMSLDTRLLVDADSSVAKTEHHEVASILRDFNF